MEPLFPLWNFVFLNDLLYQFANQASQQYKSISILIQFKNSNIESIATE